MRMMAGHAFAARLKNTQKLFQIGKNSRGITNKQFTKRLHIQPQREKATAAAALDVASAKETNKSALSPYERVDLTFDNAAEAYKSKTTFEITRALLVFNLCSIKYLITNNKEVS